MERDSGGIKRLRGTPMSPIAYFIGKGILVLVSMIVQVFLLLLVGTLFYHLHLPHSPALWLRFIWLLLLGSICSTILGIALAGVIKSGRGAPAIVSPLVIILQFISGVFFVFSDLPNWMKHVASLFPLKWLTQGMRSVFLPDSYKYHEVAKSWEIAEQLSF